MKLRITYKFLPILFISLFIIAAFSNCRNRSQQLYPYGWSRTDATFDSLTLKLEMAFHSFVTDSTLTILVDSMQRLAQADPHSPQKLARFHYWNAKLALRNRDIDSAMMEFERSIELTDSARYPYDIARIRWNMDLHEPDNAEDYFITLEKIEQFKKFNDLPIQAAFLIELGNMMVEVGDPVSGLNYYDTADSLLRICHLDAQAVGLAINRARCLEKTVDYPAAAKALESALQDSLFLQNPDAVGIARWNLYLYTDSFPILKQAYRELDRDVYADELRSVYGAFLIREFARKGEIDSVAALIPIVDRDSANIPPYYSYLRDFYLGRGAGAHALGRLEEAAQFYARAVAISEKIQEDETAEEIVNIEQRRQIEETIHRLEIERKDRTLWLLAALAALAIIAAIVIFIYQRRLNNNQREKLKAINAEKQALRKVLALELAIEENRRLGDDITQTVGSLEKEGRMDPAASDVLKATLKTHRANHPAQDSFVATFSDVDPAFMEALVAKYPQLTKTDRRLAVFIYLGLDTKHISRLTGTRPESVKQARWRLRSKMGLSENESLEAAIRSIV